MLAPTTTRVSRRTADQTNERIAQRTRERVEEAALGGAPAIGERLVELETEWDIERALEANAAVAILLGIALAISANRRWLALSAFAAAFLLQHALDGWCPPVPILRRAGVRTPREIEIERVALKILRGDFRDVPGPEAGHATVVWRALEAARR